MKKKEKEGKSFLLIYGIIIIIILLLIMFVLPDDVFMLKYKDVKLPDSSNNEVEKKEFVPYEEMQDKIITGNYDYDYLLMDSMSSKTYQYDCEGSINGSLETGTCSSPSSFSYTESTKKDLFKIDLTYLQVKEILNLIKDLEPELIEYPTRKEYYYKGIMIKGMDTDITVYTDLENITRIDINNSFMQYILKYSNITKIDN